MSNMHIPIFNSETNTSVAEKFISGDDLKMASSRMEIERRRERLWLAKAIEDVFDPVVPENELEEMISA